MPKLSEYLTIKDAAEFLGVSQNTLRNWGRDGRIKERRHPVNRYRLFSVNELNALLAAVEGDDVGTRQKRKPR